MRTSIIRVHQHDGRWRAAFDVSNPRVPVRVTLECDRNIFHYEFPIRHQMWLCAVRVGRGFPVWTAHAGVVVVVVVVAVVEKAKLQKNSTKYSVSGMDKEFCRKRGGLLSVAGMSSVVVSATIQRKRACHPRRRLATECSISDMTHVVRPSCHGVIKRKQTTCHVCNATALSLRCRSMSLSRLSNQLSSLR